MKIMVIANPSAGKGKALDLLPTIDKLLASFDIKYDIRLPESAEKSTELANLACRLGYDRIIAVGGDGTVNSVATGILGSNAILGVIPAGIGNDFFRMLKINDGFIDICRIAVFGEPISVDVGELNGRPFFNMLGIGFDAEIAQKVNEGKTNLGLLAYLISIYKVLNKYSPYPIRLRIDNVEIAEEVVLVAVGIGRVSGHGFALTPQAKIDDGKFDVCIAEKAGKIKILRVLRRILRGQHVREPGVKIYRCKQLEVYSEKPLPLQIEGETFNSSNDKLSIKMSPDKLRVAASVK